MSFLQTASVSALAALLAMAAPSYASTAGAPAKALGTFDSGTLVQVQKGPSGPAPSGPAPSGPAPSGPAMRGGGPAFHGGPAIGGGPRFSGPRFQGGPRFSGPRVGGGPRFSSRQFRGGQFAWRGQKFHNGRFAGRFHGGRFDDGFGYWPYAAAAPYLYDYGNGYSYCERVLEPRLTRNGIVMRWVRRCPGEDYYPYW